MRHKESSEFLFRVSGRHPNVWILTVEALFFEGLDHSDRWVDCDAVTRVSNASYHLAIVASGALLDSELSEQSSSMGQGRFFPSPFGRTSNHHSSDSDMLQERTKPLCFTRVLVSSFCAVRFSLRGTGGGVLMAQLRCERVQVFLCFFLAIEERLEEVPPPLV